MEGSHNLAILLTGLYTVGLVTKSTVTIGKDVLAIPVRLNRVTKLLRAPVEAEFFAGLHNSMGQPD